ncbi:uncharacterized protein LOC119688553 [Teleopsis dalmanni]|uniref:uncharacterized protein LOC119688553 n=1 Tax=Teleopsis dalmanni TaxID=139649 RepID=UPI0018CCABC6|nr:uncharacterized protein LOC119688553 [Teleopsis dalmanni]
MGSCFGRCVSKEPHSITATTSSCLWRSATDEQEAELISNATDCYKNENFIIRSIKLKKKQNLPEFIEKLWKKQDINYDKLINKNGNDSLTDIHLQNLNVNNLLTSAVFTKESTMNYTPSNNTAAASSRASSLDLEWEHEYTNIHNMTMRHYTQSSYTIIQATPTSTSTSTPPLPIILPPTTPLPPKQNSKYGNTGRNNSFTRTSSHNSWSHISTPESMEWDIDEEQQRQLHVEDDRLDHETLQLLHQIEQLKNQVLNETGDGLYELQNSCNTYGSDYEETRNGSVYRDNSNNVSTTII